MSKKKRQVRESLCAAMRNTLLVQAVGAIPRTPAHSKAPSLQVVVVVVVMVVVIAVPVSHVEVRAVTRASGGGG